MNTIHILHVSDLNKSKDNAVHIHEQNKSRNISTQDFLENKLRQEGALAENQHLKAHQILEIVDRVKAIRKRKIIRDTR